MVHQTPQKGASGSESSRMTGALSNTPPAEAQLQRGWQLVHPGTANTATEKMTLDALFVIVPKTGSSKEKKPHAIGCEYSCIKVDGRPQTI